MSSFQTFVSKYRALSDTGYLVLYRLSSLLEDVASTVDPRSSVQSRFKSASSTWAKMNLHGFAIDEIHDLMGFRVLVDEVEQCYEIVDAITQRWSTWRFEIHDYVANPKDNGYQSLHIHVAAEHDLRFEIQVRTRSMHRICEEGEAAHWRYKLSTYDFDNDRGMSSPPREKTERISEHPSSNL